ncbi:LVIVD repeat-containing protein [Chiayiivirga flava]|uniref:LVIVD repeat-containing protein n=1 Tax=Chiayiivirga flava TaxID=659595 RepID=A0A7W8D6U5_9GAMM|nr:hypothetical protein [Chiayiivirga flava]MBB5207781.1 hypothetical protein [Chiayiivirga flava]
MSRLRALPLALAAVLATPVFAATDLQLERALGGRPTDPLPAGDYVYQPSGSILTTIDASDPAAPVVTSRTDTTPLRGAITNIVSLDNGYLYAAFSGPSSETDGVAVFSLADPARPELVAQIAYDAEFRETGAVVAGNGELFVFDGGAGIFRADLSDPAAPVFTRVLDTFAGFTRGRIDGNRLYGIGRNFFGDYSVNVYDITDPAAPIALGSGSVPGASYVAAALAPPYVVGVGLGVGVFDFSAPTVPAPRGTYDDGVSVYYGGTATATHAFGLGNARLDVFDITDPDTVVPGGQFPIDTYLAEGTAFDGSDLLVATRVDRLLRIDAADPDALAQRSTSILAGGSVPYDIGFNAGHAYILGNDFGIQVADAATLEPQALVEPDIEQVPMSRAYEELLVDGDRTYLASWGSGVVILDSSDPAAPVQIGFVEAFAATSMAVRGDVLFLGTSTNGGLLAAIDVSDAGAPIVRDVEITSKAMRVRTAGNLVLVADHVFDENPAGLRLFDGTDPANLQLLSIYNTDCEYASDVVVSDDLTTAYVACSEGLHILDITDPAAPARIGRLQVADPGAPFNALAVDGESAWYGTDSGIVEIDIADAANPVERQRLPLPAAPRSLRLGPDATLYAATGYSGLFVFGEEPVEPLPPEIFADGFE